MGIVLLQRQFFDWSDQNSGNLSNQKNQSEQSVFLAILLFGYKNDFIKKLSDSFSSDFQPLIIIFIVKKIILCRTQLNVSLVTQLYFVKFSNSNFEQKNSSRNTWNIFLEIQISFFQCPLRTQKVTMVTRK